MSTPNEKSPGPSELVPRARYEQAIVALKIVEQRVARMERFVLDMAAYIADDQAQQQRGLEGIASGWEVTNADRAGWARTAMQAFADATRWLSDDRNLDDAETREEVAGDLLCDLRHLLGEDLFDRAAARGARNYLEEVYDAAESS